MVAAVAPYSSGHFGRWSIRGIGARVGKTGRMDNRDGAHPLAAWVRQPEVSAVTVALLGLNLLVASLFVPIGVTNIALSALGAACIVAGVLTLLLHLLGRAARLHRRAARVVEQGREAVLLPGVRPPEWYVRSRAPQTVAAPGPREGGRAVIDLTAGHQDTAPTVPLPAVPEPARTPSPRAGTAVG